MGMWIDLLREDLRNLAVDLDCKAALRWFRIGRRDPDVHPSNPECTEGDHSKLLTVDATTCSAAVAAGHPASSNVNFGTT